MSTQLEAENWEYAGEHSVWTGIEARFEHIHTECIIQNVTSVKCYTRHHFFRRVIFIKWWKFKARSVICVVTVDINTNLLKRLCKGRKPIWRTTHHCHLWPWVKVERKGKIVRSICLDLLVLAVISSMQGQHSARQMGFTLQRIIFELSSDRP